MASQPLCRCRHSGWGVRELPLTTAEVSDGGLTPIGVPGFATVRTNPFTGASGAPEALGVVDGGYTLLQNEDNAEFLNLLADESGAIFDTAGSLRGGRQVFVAMQLPDSLTVGGTDRVDLNIPHSTATTAPARSASAPCSLHCGGLGIRQRAQTDQPSTNDRGGAPWLSSESRLSVRSRARGVGVAVPSPFPDHPVTAGCALVPPRGRPRTPNS